MSKKLTGKITQHFNCTNTVKEVYKVTSFTGIIQFLRACYRAYKSQCNKVFIHFNKQ